MRSKAVVPNATTAGRSPRAIISADIVNRNAQMAVFVRTLGTLRGSLGLQAVVILRLNHELAFRCLGYIERMAGT